MTDNEIIKAFNICYMKSEKFCTNCPFYDGKGHCTDVPKASLLHKVGDVLNRQQAEIESLTEKVEAMGDPLQDAQYKIAEQQAEIERLLKAINDKHCVYEKRVVSEAIKEFWEKLKGEVVPTITAMFIISEILVAHSKREISPERALTKIREELLLQNPICSRPKLEEVIDNLVKEMVGDAE